VPTSVRWIHQVHSGRRWSPCRPSSVWSLAWTNHGVGSPDHFLNQIFGDKRICLYLCCQMIRRTDPTDRTKILG
jgi:hypothetical protein